VTPYLHYTITITLVHAPGASPVTEIDCCSAQPFLLLFALRHSDNRIQVVYYRLLEGKGMGQVQGVRTKGQVRVEVDINSNGHAHGSGVLPCAATATLVITHCCHQAAVLHCWARRGRD